MKIPERYLKATSFSFDVIAIAIIVLMLVGSAMYLTGRFFESIPFF